MTYYVISGDGQRYGPADLATLNQWAIEGRLLANQMVEDESTGIRMAASSVPGLIFPQQAPTGGGYQQYPRATASGYAGQSDITQAWVFGALGLCCCGFIFGILGLLAANRAERAGNPNATAPKIFNIAVIVIWVVGGFLRGIVFRSANPFF
ncbi:MAG: hypothetical protein ACAH95_10575 [Fimbriimonas sp.]